MLASKFGAAFVHTDPMSLLTCHYTGGGCATNATPLPFDVCAPKTCISGSTASFESLTGLGFVEEEAGSKSRALNGVFLKPYLNGTGPSRVYSLFSAHLRDRKWMEDSRSPQDF